MIKKTAFETEQMFFRGKGYWDGSNAPVGKMESARRQGYLSGCTMSGEPLDPDRRDHDYPSSSPNPPQQEPTKDSQIGKCLGCGETGPVIDIRLKRYSLLLCKECLDSFRALHGG